jgi:hypothetical protein
MQAALRYALHESWQEFLLFVRGENFIDDDGGKLRIATYLLFGVPPIIPDRCGGMSLVLPSLFRHCSGGGSFPNRYSIFLIIT